ncbi:hypothetical protein IT399_01540 [Candidatus Nomurabacteria bacterium]|nr:hypothetical protein [Candidatus Nomurabacteria bacterium]
MQKIKNFIIKSLPAVFIFFMLFIPSFYAAHGATSLIPCNNMKTAADGTVTPAGECDFTALMTLVDTVIKFLLFKMVIPIAAILFTYTGFLIVTAPGAEAKTKAKDTFSSVVIGLIIAVAGYLIVKTLLSILGYDGAWIGL